MNRPKVDMLFPLIDAMEKQGMLEKQAWGAGAGKVAGGFLSRLFSRGGGQVATRAAAPAAAIPAAQVAAPRVGFMGRVRGAWNAFRHPELADGVQAGEYMNAMKQVQKLKGNLAKARNISKGRRAQVAQSRAETQRIVDELTQLKTKNPVLGPEIDRILAHPELAANKSIVGKGVEATNSLTQKYDNLLGKIRDAPFMKWAPLSFKTKYLSPAGQLETLGNVVTHPVQTFKNVAKLGVGGTGVYTLWDSLTGNDKK